MRVWRMASMDVRSQAAASALCTKGHESQAVAGVAVANVMLRQAVLAARLPKSTPALRLAVEARC